MVDNRKFTYKVGIFVTLGTMLLAAFIIVLGGNRGFFKSYYRMKVILEEAQGLANGSGVSVGGVQAGNVESIEFNPDGLGMLVTVKLETDVKSRITEGSTVSMRTQGALGDKFLYIAPGPRQARPLEPDSIIPLEGSSDLLSTLSRSGGKFEKIFEAIEHLNHILKGIDQSGLVERVGTAAGSFRNSSLHIETITKSLVGSDGKQNSVKKSLDHISSILEKIDKGRGTIGSLINDPTVHEEIKTILGGAKRSKVLKYLIKSAIEKGEEAEEEKQK